jgi:hypothetical protein
MEQERREADQSLGERVAPQEISPTPRQAATKPGADRHPAHEERKHQSLRVRRVAEEKLEVVAPDRLVDQPREPGDGEEQEKYAAGDAPHRRGIIRAEDLIPCAQEGTIER